MAEDYREALWKSLERLEIALDTPFVPGDLENWLDEARAAAEAVQGSLVPQLAEVHPAEFQQIEAEDPGLSSRVEEMRAGDKAILDSFERFRGQLDRLAKIDSPERNESEVEARFKDELDELVNRGLAMVVQARKQEVSVRTWMMESVDRDRGTVD